MTHKYKSDFLNILEQRGFIHQCSDFEELDNKLSSSKQGAYIGFDATANSLHVGSLVQIMMLYWFQQCGHQPYTLMGGGTTKVGDPSGKDESRKMLTEDIINENIEGIKGIIGKFLNYDSGDNKAIMVNNAEWLEDLNYIEFLRDCGPHFTINRMLTFESVKLRLDREQPLTFLEFNYMLLQAYDFLELYKRHEIILQMGGSDQWGNIINGVELGRRKASAQLYALTTPLLTTASGAKMGKTADGAVWLDEKNLSPYDYYQFWRNTEDADVARFLKLFTTMPMEEITKLEKLQGAEVNEAKKILAFEATKICHGEKAASEAQATAQTVFEQGGLGGDLPVIEIEKGALEGGLNVIDMLVEAGFCASKGEAKRLIKGGGARINDVSVGDIDAKITSSDLNDQDQIKISSGKKKHAILKA
mgnify:CR=1 FL=1|tara:strand:+ start:294 stop:1547 length:1254 start_codon:yes stop_codon:yes gene_type:complete